MDLQDLETELTAIDERRFGHSEGILIYLNGPQWRAVFTNGQSLTELSVVAQVQARARLGGKVLYFAPDPAWLCGHVESAQEGAEEQGPGERLAGAFIPRRFDYQAEQPPAFAAVEGDELDDLIAQASCVAIEEGLPRCIVGAPPGVHFELPSKSHASHFIRLSEAFDCIESVQRVAYWVVVSLVRGLARDVMPPERVFLVDHPTMLLLGTHVNLVYGGVNKVLSLKGYPSESVLRTQASKLLQTVTIEKPGVAVTALIGIASTGKLARILRELAGPAGAQLDVCLVFAPLEIVGDTKPLAQLEISGYVHALDAASCELCAGKKAPLIHIHSQSFLISVAPPTEIRLPMEFFGPQRAFLDRYGAVPGVLRIHFDDPNELFPRHHAFGIDATVLLRDEDFLQEVVATLEGLEPKPDFVLIPEHKATPLLRSVIAQWRNIPTVTPEELEGLRGALPARPTVLVFDDKVVSGQRFSNLNVFLREVRQPPLWQSLNHVHFFAPVVTTESEKHYRDMVTGLTKNPLWTARFHEVCCLHLPHWHTSSDCPWCQEEKWLEVFAEEANSFDSPLTERLDLLSRRVPLPDMRCLASMPDGREFPVLGNGSAAANPGASQLTLLIAAASAIQQRRHSLVNPLQPFSLAHPTTLEAFVVKTAYSEKLIAFAILRALLPAEVSVSMREHLAQLLKYPQSVEGMEPYQVELVMALLEGKVGNLKDIAAAWDVMVEYGVSEDSLSKLGFKKPEPQ